jgi:hypothetical protein
MEFSLHRVLLLSKKQAADNRQIYTLSLLVTMGISALIFGYYSLATASGLDSGTQAFFFTGLCTVAGAILSATILSQFNDKVQGIQALMLPASALEKTVAAVFLGLVIFPLVYIIAVYPILLLIHWLDVGAMGHKQALYVFDSFDFGEVYFVLQAMVLLFSVFFKRYSAIKTALAIFVVFFGVITLNDIIANGMLPAIPTGPPFLNTADELPQEKWDPSTYIKANLHKVYYDTHDNLIVDQMVESLIAGRIINHPPFNRMTVNSIIHTGEVFKSQKNKDQEVPPNVAFTESTYVTLSKAQNGFFDILLYLSVPLMWLATWFRLRETQL